MNMRAITCLLLAGCLLVPACAKKYGDDYAVYYPDCRQPILDMQSRGSMASSSAMGAAGGAIIGGATGFFLGLLLNGGNVADAGISAAVGAGTGALSGGISGAVGGAHDEADENRLLAGYYEKLDGDISGLTLPQAAGTVALQCYEKKLAQVGEMEDSGRLTPDEANARRAEIENGMIMARQLAGQEDQNREKAEQ